MVGGLTKKHSMAATPSTTRTSTLHWICQPTVTDYQQTLWQQALTMMLDKYNLLLQQLGPAWDSKPNQQWAFYYNEETEMLMLSIHSPTPCEQFCIYPNGNKTSPSDFFFDKDTYPMKSPPNYTLLAPVNVITNDDFSTICTMLRLVRFAKVFERKK